MKVKSFSNKKHKTTNPHFFGLIKKHEVEIKKCCKSRQIPFVFSIYTTMNILFIVAQFEQEGNSALATYWGNNST